MSATAAPRPRAPRPHAPHVHAPHAHGWIADRLLSWTGTVLVALPLLAGAVMAVMALAAGRFGGPGNAVTAFWYPALAASPVAVVGAVLLLVALRWQHRRRRTALFWTGVAVIGLTVSLGLPRVTGMAFDAAALTGLARTAFFATSAGTIGGYLVGLLALVVIGVRHLREHERRRVG